VPDTPRAEGSASARSQIRDHAGVWQEYLSRIGRGDETALAQLYDESSASVYSLALRMLASPADAEEITCDVYSHIWRNAAGFDARRGNPWSWMAMLCRSRCIDRMRSRSTRRTAEVPLSPADLEGLPDPLWPAEVQIRREAVREALEGLEPNDQNLLRLAFFSGLTHSELSEQLHLPLGTIKSRIRLSIQKMRHLLEGLPA
jgi:RNA polymerase sigma-70 factor, ECF subfamily